MRRRGEKAIVLLNRRGWSNFLSCRLCGRVWECPDCDVTLVLHQAAGELACHHCGHRGRRAVRVPGLRLGLGGAPRRRHGAARARAGGGGQRRCRCSGSTRTSPPAPGIAGVLRAFEAAEAGVLVGTQMVAKGHDFPDVTLGVVLDADATLRFPDFRAEERTFSLVAQLAGRSGRGERGGRVIVQALEPQARALAPRGRRTTPSGFLADELPRREAFAYPPYGHLIRVVCSAAEPGPEHEAAAAVRELIEAAGVPVLGPAPLFRRQARHRAQLVVRSREREPAIVAVRAAVEAVAADRAHAGAAFAVDVDPQ